MNVALALLATVCALSYVRGDARKVYAKSHSEAQAWQQATVREVRVTPTKHKPRGAAKTRYRQQTDSMELRQMEWAQEPRYAEVLKQLLLAEQSHNSEAQLIGAGASEDQACADFITAGQWDQVNSWAAQAHAQSKLHLSAAVGVQRRVALRAMRSAIAASENADYRKPLGCMDDAEQTFTLAWSELLSTAAKRLAELSPPIDWTEVHSGWNAARLDSLIQFVQDTEAATPGASKR